MSEKRGSSGKNAKTGALKGKKRSTRTVDRKSKASPADSKPSRPRLNSGERAEAAGLSKESEQIAAGWFPLWLMAAAFGCSKQSLHDHIRPLVDKTDVRGAGERGTLLRCRGVVDAWVKHKLKGVDSGEAGINFGGTDSPWIEVLREYNARLKKLEYEDQTKELIPRHQLVPALAQFASLIRRAIETLQRQFGDEPAAIVDDAITEAVSAWEKMLKDLA